MALTHIDERKFETYLERHGFILLVIPPDHAHPMRAAFRAIARRRGWMVRTGVDGVFAGENDPEGTCRVWAVTDHEGKG